MQYDDRFRSLEGYCYMMLSPIIYNYHAGSNSDETILQPILIHLLWFGNVLG